MLLAAELLGFVPGNPPSSTSSATVLPLAPEAHQFFLTGELEIADRYFPWLVNLMSPAYWVYLVMAVTILFNVLKAFSRFRLWRIDSAREKLRSTCATGAGVSWTSATRDSQAWAKAIDPCPATRAGQARERAH